MAVNEFKESGIYPLNHNMFMSHGFATHVEEEVADCEQNAYIPTLSRKRQ
jgi:hypothetical protein